MQISVEPQRGLIPRRRRQRSCPNLSSPLGIGVSFEDLEPGVDTLHGAKRDTS